MGYISITPLISSVAGNSTSTTVFIMSSGIDSSTLTVDASDFTSYEINFGNELTLHYEKNPTDKSRDLIVTVEAYDTDNILRSATATIRQAGISPIWKPIVFYDSSGEPFIEYHITVDGNIVYAGKAYLFEGEEQIEWQVNDVFSNYLGNGIVFEEELHQIPNYMKDFTLETNTGEVYTQAVYNSWAYKDTDYWLSDPIDYRVDPRQWLPVSFLSTNYDRITVNNDEYIADEMDKGWTVMSDLNNYLLECGGNFLVEGANGENRKYLISSGDYVLYYSNAYGGWDSLLCNATSKKTDNIEHLNYRKHSKNQSEFSKVNYQNTITPTWTLKTGNTINGEKMYHLLESTMVYLHNLKTNEIIPVVITNSNCEYLNYTNNGKNPYFYTITVEESNIKLRK